jgi:hypothetical protein
MPALIAANASSSGTGVGFQVIIISPCYGQTRAVIRYRWRGTVNRIEELTATFPTTALESGLPSLTVWCAMTWWCDGVRNRSKYGGERSIYIPKRQAPLLSRT